MTLLNNKKKTTGEGDTDVTKTGLKPALSHALELCYQFDVISDLFVKTQNIVIDGWHVN